MSSRRDARPILFQRVWLVVHYNSSVYNFLQSLLWYFILWNKEYCVRALDVADTLREALIFISKKREPCFPSFWSFDEFARLQGFTSSLVNDGASKIFFESPLI